MTSKSGWIKGDKGEFRLRFEIRRQRWVMEKRNGKRNMEIEYDNFGDEPKTFDEMVLAMYQAAHGEYV